MAEERERINLNRKQLILLKKIVMPKKRWNCHYCKKRIDPSKEDFSLYNKPNRIICGSILCINEAIEEEQA